MTKYKVDQEFMVKEKDADYSIDSMADLDSLLDVDDSKEKDKDDDNNSDDDDGDDDSDNADDTDDEPGDDQEDDDQDADTDDEAEKESEEKEDASSKKQTKDKPKDNKAFAAMRSENNNLKRQISEIQATMKQLALGLGMDAEDKDLLGKLNEVALKGRAKKEDKTPEQLAQEQQLLGYQQKEIKDHTYSEIAAIKNEFGATDDELKEFLGDMLAQGIDPFKARVELKAKYMSANYDKIIQAATDKAVEEALKRDNAADEHGSKSKKKGKKGSSTGHKIETKAELDAYIDSL